MINFGLWVSGADIVEPASVGSGDVPGMLRVLNSEVLDSSTVAA